MANANRPQRLFKAPEGTQFAWVISPNSSQSPEVTHQEMATLLFPWFGWLTLTKP